MDAAIYVVTNVYSTSNDNDSHKEENDKIREESKTEYEKFLEEYQNNQTKNYNY